MKYFKSTFSLVFIILLFSCSGHRDVTVRELKEHIIYLSSDSLKGRLTGSPGDSLAAEYIRKEFLSYGLIPLSGDGMQRYKVTNRIAAGKNNSLLVNGVSFVPEKDFMPLSFSSNGTLESDVIFAGYGFNINTDSLKRNDYSGIDVKGKWVMVLRAEPDPDNSNNPYIPFSGDRDKALLAKDMGASGVLMVSGPAFDPQDTFESLNNEGFSVGIPVLRIKREVADAILLKSKTRIESLEKDLNRT